MVAGGRPPGCDENPGVRDEGFSRWGATLFSDSVFAPTCRPVSQSPQLRQTCQSGMGSGPLVISGVSPWNAPSLERWCTAVRRSGRGSQKRLQNSHGTLGQTQAVKAARRLAFETSFSRCPCAWSHQRLVQSVLKRPQQVPLVSCIPHRTVLAPQWCCRAAKERP